MSNTSTYPREKHPSEYVGLEHTMSDRTPYCYLIGWTEHDLWYYGRKTQSGCHPSTFWIDYFTSSVHVERFRKEHGEPDVIQIRRVFSDTEKCKLWECGVLGRIDAVNHEKMLNKSNNRLDRTGRCCARDHNGKLHDVKVDDPRLETGELIRGVTQGMTTGRDKDGNTHFVSKDDPRFETGELMHANCGTATAKLPDGTFIKVLSDDPRFETGELVHAACGTATAKLPDGTFIKVLSDDPRFETGELVHATKGMTTGRDKDGNTHFVSKDDPRFVTGELLRGVTRGMTTGRDKDGNTHFVSKDDPRFETGELMHANKNTTFIMNVSTFQVFRVPVTDSRMQSEDFVVVAGSLVDAEFVSSGKGIKVWKHDPRFDTGELRLQEPRNWFNDGVLEFKLKASDPATKSLSPGRLSGRRKVS